MRNRGYVIALLVVILGTPNTQAEALSHFQQLWLYAAGMALLSGVIATRLGPTGAGATATAPAATQPARAA